jgi:cell division protein FtsB
MVGYFVHHANTGARGLEAKELYNIQAQELSRELDGARKERAEWERRIALLRSDQIDRDLLEERARVMLGRVHKNDLVIITGP